MPDIDSFIPLSLMKDHLGLTPDQDADDLLIQAKIEAAENHINRLLGYVMRDRFLTLDAVPSALKEAVLQLAAWWFENREAATDMSRELPFGVREIVSEYREWTF